MRELRYKIVLQPLSESDGGGWLAEVPQLPNCYSDGDTPEEAATSALKAAAVWIESAAAHGRPVPEPSAFILEEFSGKFTLRVPRSLHRDLASMAERDGISLNQLLISLISLGMGRKEVVNDLKNILAETTQPHCAGDLTGFAYRAQKREEHWEDIQKLSGNLAYMFGDRKEFV